LGSPASKKLSKLSSSVSHGGPSQPPVFQLFSITILPINSNLSDKGLVVLP